MIELSRVRVAFDLPFPIVQVASCLSSDTVPKLLTFLGRQGLNLFENFFYGRTHGFIVGTEGIEGKSLREQFSFSRLAQPPLHRFAKDTAAATEELTSCIMSGLLCD